MLKKFGKILSIIIMLLLIVCLITLCIVVYSLFQEDDNAIKKAVGNVYNKIEEFIVKNDGSDMYRIELISSTIPGSDVTKYFYDQLNDYSKTIYSKLEIEKEHLKTGTYKLEFGDIFSDLLSKENGADLLGEYYQSAIETFLYDNPDIFYIEPSKMYINIQKTSKPFKTIYSVYIDSGKEDNYLIEEFEDGTQNIETAIAEVEKKKDEIITSLVGKTAYHKILTIHDYLIDNIDYDESVGKPNIYNIYGALVRGECVCEGYAKAFKYLLNEANIQNVIVIGTAVNSKGNTENHAWNYVQLGDKWYAVDVTWDDPVIRGSGYVPRSYKYKYFLVGSGTINKDHTATKQFTENGQEYEYPVLSADNFTN